MCHTYLAETVLSSKKHLSRVPKYDQSSKSRVSFCNMKKVFLVDHQSPTCSLIHDFKHRQIKELILIHPFFNTIISF